MVIVYLRCFEYFMIGGDELITFICMSSVVKCCFKTFFMKAFSFVGCEMNIKFSETGRFLTSLSVQHSKLNGQ